MNEIVVKDIEYLESGDACITLELSEEVREKLLSWAIQEIIKRSIVADRHSEVDTRP